MNENLDEWLLGYINAAPIAMLLLDECQVVVQVNQVALTRFGYIREELLQKPLALFAPAFVRQIPASSTVTNSAVMFAQEQELVHRVQGKLKNGINIPFALKVSNVQSQGGTFELYALVETSATSDMDHAARIQLQLSHQSLRLVIENERLRNELSDFSYVVSHDLEEPIRKIVMSCQALMEDHAAELEQPIRRWVDFAVSGATRMQQMIKDLLTYSRIAVPARPSRAISTMDAVHIALNRLQDEIKESQTQVVVHPLPTAFADESLLIQLFTNLIGNAVKFGRTSGPRLEIGVVVSDSGLNADPIFFVRDNGIGIEPEYYDRIFMVFQRLHRKDQYAGTGIGLAICKKIVERHGGKIWVESQLEEGSTFYFQLVRSSHSPNAGSDCATA